MNNAAKRIAHLGVGYVPNFLKLNGTSTAEQLWEDLPWEERTTARRECFFNLRGTDYTYGNGQGQRTYVPVADDHPTPSRHFIDWVRVKIAAKLFPDFENVGFPPVFEACFVNGYGDKTQHLGWHADDSPLINHEHPIVVVSLGSEREIWWREIEEDTSGLIFTQKLGNGSMFVMPAGMQQTHQHRIPKSDREVAPRISLTFRSLL